MSMKTSKQIVVKLSVVETLDRIREHLPARGSQKASYGDAIEWLERKMNRRSWKIERLEEMIRRKAKK